jgi:hypothetical protein
MSKQPSLKRFSRKLEAMESRLADSVGDIRRDLLELWEEVESFGERLSRLEEFTGVNEVESFSIQQTGDENMAVTGIAPGATGTFTATPLDSNGNPIPLPAGAAPPVWSSSDNDNAPVVASADGLSASVSVPATTAGGSFTLTVQSPDLPGTPIGSVVVPINAVTPPPQTVASFAINQTS